MGRRTTLLARVSASTVSPGTLVNQVAVSSDPTAVAPNISEGMSYYLSQKVREAVGAHCW